MLPMSLIKIIAVDFTRKMTGRLYGANIQFGFRHIALNYKIPKLSRLQNWINCILFHLLIVDENMIFILLSSCWLSGKKKQQQSNDNASEYMNFHLVWLYIYITSRWRDCMDKKCIMHKHAHDCPISESLLYNLIHTWMHRQVSFCFPSLVLFFPSRHKVPLSMTKKSIFSSFFIFIPRSGCRMALKFRQKIISFVSWRGQSMRFFICFLCSQSVSNVTLMQLFTYQNNWMVPLNALHTMRSSISLRLTFR